VTLARFGSRREALSVRATVWKALHQLAVAVVGLKLEVANDAKSRGSQDSSGVACGAFTGPPDHLPDRADVSGQPGGNGRLGDRPGPLVAYASPWASGPSAPFSSVAYAFTLRT
jgi:hypothetical protein